MNVNEEPAAPTPPPDEIVLLVNAHGQITSCNEAGSRYQQAEARDGKLPAALQSAFQYLRSVSGADAPEETKDLTLTWEGTEQAYEARLCRLAKVGGDEYVYALVLKSKASLQAAAGLTEEKLSKISHELRTPLTSMRMAIYLLQEEAVGPLNNDQQELISTAKEEIENLLAKLDGYSSGGQG